ncbi:hypothetical protein GEMRC1_000613 [Eukaryota sp. GEM-RC1]
MNYAFNDIVEAALNVPFCPEISSRQVELLDEMAERDCSVVYAAEFSTLPVAFKLVSLSEKEGGIKLRNDILIVVQLIHPMAFALGKIVSE